MFEKTRIQNQDDWKRTQLRIPFNQYDAVTKYAIENNLSLNSAMLELIEKGLSISNVNTTSNFASSTLENAEKLETLLNRIDDLEQNMKNTNTFDKVEIKKISDDVYVLAIDTATDSRYYLAITDIPSLSKDGLNGAVLTINQNGTTLKYTGDDAEEMFEKIPKLLREMDWRNNSIHSPESIYNRNKA